MVTGNHDLSLDEFKLTPRQREFVKIYLVNGHNALGAYLEMNPGTKRSTAVKESRRLRHHPSVNGAIRMIVGHSLNSAIITNERILAEIACLAFVDPIDYLDEDGSAKPLSEVPEEARRAISGLDIQEMWEGAGLNRKYVGKLKKLGIANKMQALLALAKIRKMITDKVEISPSEDLAVLLAKARKRTAPAVEVTLENLFE